MSLFGFLGKKQEPKQDKTAVMAEALQKIDEQVQMLDKKGQVLQRRILECSKQAKAAKKKERALPHLRRRKRIMKQVDLINGQINNLESQRFAMENATTMASTLEGMKFGKDALKKQGLDIDNMQDELDEVAEEMQKIDEVGEVMSQPLFGSQMDDDELMEEWEAELLEDEQLGEELGEAQVEMPDVPTTELKESAEEEPAESSKASANKEDEELEALSSW